MNNARHEGTKAPAEAGKLLHEREEPEADHNTPLLDVRNLTVFMGHGKRRVRIVDHVSLSVGKGRTLGLVGESGSGKTTLARAVLRLVDAEGSVILNGVDLLKLSGSQLTPMRRSMQIVFQDPIGSLNPRMTVGQILAEPIKFHRLRQGTAVTDRVHELLQWVGLRPEHAARYPHEFSGGDRQRIGICRALAVEPKLLICDEPVSALDVSVQAQILNLLQDLQARLGLTYLFIAHNLAVVEHFCDDVAVMYRGRIVERAPADQIFVNPVHPYTRLLLDSIPGAASSGGSVRIAGGPLSNGAGLNAMTGGCAFAPRCPLAQPICIQGVPRLSAVPGAADHEAACVLIQNLTVTASHLPPVA